MIMQILRMREQARRRLTFSQAVSVKCLFLTQSGHGGSYAITTLLFDVNQIRGSPAQTNI
jgi:hypothetical protein